MDTMANELDDWMVKRKQPKQSVTAVDIFPGAVFEDIEDGELFVAAQTGGDKWQMVSIARAAYYLPPLEKSELAAKCEGNMRPRRDLVTAILPARWRETVEKCTDCNQSVCKGWGCDVYTAKLELLKAAERKDGERR